MKLGEYDFASLENLNGMDYGSVIQAFNDTWEMSTHKTLRGVPLSEYDIDCGGYHTSDAAYDDQGRCIWSSKTGICGPAACVYWDD